MKQKNCSFFSLLIMLLFSLSSTFAAVTVTYQPGSFPYNTSGNNITARVNSTENIAAFDIITKVRSDITGAFGTVTAINVAAVAGAAADLTQVDGSTDDFTRIFGFNCATPIIMAPGTYDFIFTVTTSCDTGRFCLEDGGQWLVDPDPVYATTMFANTSSGAASVNVVPGCYRVYNTAPTITNCPNQALVFNACTIVTYDFDATDPDNECLPAADLTWSKVSGPGGIDAVTGEFEWDPPAVVGICGLHEIVVRVTDEYGAFADCTFEVSLQSDAPFFTACPTLGSELFIYWGWTADGDVDATDPDACPLALAYSLNSFSGPVTAGPFTVNAATGVWSWPTAFADPAYLGDHTVIIDVTDGCNTASCQFVIHVAPTFNITIEKTHNTIQGHIEHVSIDLGPWWTEGFGGFDLLIAYDASALNFLGATPGSILTTCGWEYFTYRFGASGNCTGGCPSGLLRIVAIADMNNGPNHPSCFGEGLIGSLAELQFLVTNDRTFECQYVPISFYWLDCGDNTFSSITGDTLFISRKVYMYGSPMIDVTGQPNYGGWQGLGIDCMNQLGQKYHPDTVVDFWGGGIDIVCADSIDDRGDLNLNGIENEIADGVLYTNYFLYGIAALDPDPNYREAQIAASDVNADGIPLTVGDLVYLIRIIVGDALPFAKLVPFASTVDIKAVNGTVSSVSTDNIGALHLTFDLAGSYNVVSHTNMEVKYAENEGKLHVLIYSGMENMTNSIPAGTNELLTVTGAELNSVEVADYYGNLMYTRVAKTALPTEFALSQNIPNPFNPTTKIGLDLPVTTDWKVDIYNVNGQLVQSFNGTNIGHIEVTWDATTAASGIYFYKATAGAFSETKKMVLMK
jgi:hypothetical protein